MRKHILGLMAAFCAMAMLSTTSWASTDAGIVLATSGDATAKGASGTARKLDRRSPINVGDTLATGADGKMQIRMKDGTVIALGNSTEFAVQSYSFKGAGDTRDSATLKLVKGSLMQVSGRMEKSAYNLETPVSTLGIRGTVFNIIVNPDGSVTATVNEGTVVSAAKAAVAAAKATLDEKTAKLQTAQKALADAKANCAKISGGCEEGSLGPLEAAVKSADAELSDAQAAYDTAVADAATVINAGDAANTDGSGNTGSTQPVSFTALTPLALITDIATNYPEYLNDIAGPLKDAFPDQAQQIQNIVDGASSNNNDASPSSNDRPEPSAINSTGPAGGTGGGVSAP